MSWSRPSRLAVLIAVFFVAVIGNTAPSPTQAEIGPVLTAGCGRTWAAGADVSGTLLYGSLQRTYLFHIPLGYIPSKPTMLVLNLHGSGMTSQTQAMLTHMSATADANNFIVVYPQGTTGMTNMTGWDVEPPGWPGSTSNPYRNVDDVGFLNALVTSLEGQLCIDTTRIDATGISFGAVMAYNLACSNTPWLAAIAVVAGTTPRPQNMCTLAHPSPLLAFHGKLDPISWYGGLGPFNPSIPTIVANWAHAVGCPGTGQTGFAQGDVVETVYTSCANGADTVLYTVTDGGHEWPSGIPMPWFGKTTTVIDASALMFAFFASHPLH